MSPPHTHKRKHTHSDDEFRPCKSTLKLIANFPSFRSCSQNRLASLYSDFSAQKTLNPSGYAANLSAWKKALFHACRKGKIPAVAAATSQSTKRRKLTYDDDEGASATDYLSFSTGEELARALELRPYGRPTGLSEVIKDAVERRELVPLDEYLKQVESIYSRRWVPTPWEVVRWGLRSLGLVGQTGNFTVGKFVVVENVELAAQEVVELQRSLANGTTAGIYSLRTFTDTFEHVLGENCVLSASDVQVLLRFMSRDRPSLSYNAESSTIKFAPSETTKPTPVEENDISIAQVKTLQLTLEQAIPPLEARYTELDTRVRTAVAKKDTTAAKSFLKARKLLEGTLAQRRSNLLQVEESLHAIETAATNVEIVHAMQESTKVMRDLNSKVGGVEGVERITDAMRDEMETVEEVGRAIAEPGMEAGGVVVDEEEVDEEFEKLMAGERAKEEAARAAEEAKKAKEEAERAEEQRQKEEKDRLERLKEEELKEKLRRLEEWEKFQQAAKEEEEKKKAEEEAKKDELERRFAELSQPLAVNPMSPTSQAVESTRQGVKDITLEDQQTKETSEAEQDERHKEPVLA
jgi:charged multivesicular body protein 7